ncbi:MAG: tetratricopeptide repeat protein [Pseudomonadota bacterium]
MTHRHLICASAIAALLAFAGPSTAQVLPDLPDALDEAPEIPLPPEEPPEGAEGDPALPAVDLPDEEMGREAQLEALFDQLGAEEQPHWQVIQAQIWRVWRRSGSDSADYLLRRSLRAIEGKDYDTALVHLDDLVALYPDFAEAWNQRATVHFLEGSYGESVRDIETVLALEPRHFGALSGLGIILDRLGQEAGAVLAYRRALELNPHLEGAQRGVERLAPDVDGREL